MFNEIVDCIICIEAKKSINMKIEKWRERISCHENTLSQLHDF